MLTKSEREAIRERADAATSGPWFIEDSCVCAHSTDDPNDATGYEVFDDDDLYGYTQRLQNRRFAAHARSDIPALLDALDAAEQRAADREHELTRQRDDAVRDYEIRIERLKAEIEAERVTNRALRQWNEELGNVSDRLYAEIERLKAEIHDLRAGIKLVRDSCDAGIAERDAKIETLKAEIETFKAELKRIDEDKAYLVQANLANDWEERYQSQQTRIEMKDEEIAQRDRTIERLKAEAQTAAREYLHVDAARTELVRDIIERDATIAEMRKALEQCSMCGGSGQMRGIKKDCDTGACSEFFEDCMACAQFRAALESGAGSKLLVVRTALAKKSA